LQATIAEITRPPPKEVGTMTKIPKSKTERARTSATKERTAALKAADTERFVRSLIGADMHVARVASLARAALGVTVAGSLAIHAIRRRGV
jgi:hypothetical protein